MLRGELLFVACAVAAARCSLLVGTDRCVCSLPVFVSARGGFHLWLGGLFSWRLLLLSSRHEGTFLLGEEDQLFVRSQFCTMDENERSLCCG